MTRRCLRSISISSATRSPPRQDDRCCPHHIMMMSVPRMSQAIVAIGLAVRGVKNGCSGLSAEERWVGGVLVTTSHDEERGRKRKEVESSMVR